MTGVSISDRLPTGVLCFDLIDILDLIGEDAVRSEWKVSGLECLGQRADEFHAIADAVTPISGAALRSLAHGIYQTIDGRFEAFLPTTDTPWLIIRAADSSCFDVETEQPDILDQLRKRFSAVVDLP